MTFQRSVFSLSGLALASMLGLLAAPQAHALGRLTDVQVVDRDSGETLPVYRHQGEHWVAGRPGARYAVAVRNQTPGRILGVVSVDGVNAVSGETAAVHQTGYVLHPWQLYNVTGWRKSDSEVAAFHFTASPASYAERTGRPAEVGVIGVAVFREKPLPPPPPAVSLPYQEHRQPELAQQRSRALELPSGPLANAPEPSSAPQDSARADQPSAAESAMLERRMAPASPAPRLGTGHGEREHNWITQTTFERRSHRPDEIIRIRYDSHANLVAMGIIPTRATPPRPNPFPVPTAPGYAPDPY
jgi:hypothetical protein